MATAAVQCEQIDEILQCSVCMETFTDPRALPCLHTFCLQCITDWCKYKQIKDRVACPECRQEFAIPDSGIDSLQKNFFIGNLLSINEKTCKKDHLSFCDKHKDRQLELYCLEDKRVICSDCHFLEHRTHHCEDLKRIAEEFRSGKQKQGLQTAKLITDKLLEVLHLRSSHYFDHVKKVKTEICKEAERMVELIKSHKEKLLIELKEIETNYEKQINCLTREFTEAKSGLALFETYCDQLGSDVNICRELDSLRKRAGELASVRNLEDSLKQFDVTNVSFSPARAIFDDSENVLGSIETEIKVTVASNLMDEGEGITALALANNELYFARYGVRRVSVYNSSTLQVRSTITIPGRTCAELRGLAACSFNKFLFVADTAGYINNSSVMDYCVHKVDLSSPTNKMSNWTVAGLPCGLSTTSKHNVLVVINTSSTTSKVQEYTPAGNLVRQISDNNLLYQAVETKGGTLLATRCGNPTHGIVEYNWHGQVMRCYGNKMGSGPDRMNIGLPLSLAVTSDGNIFVTDYNNDRIQLLDSSLKTARSLKIPADIKLYSPSALCYDESRGRLYVGELNGENRLLVIDHVITNHAHQMTEFITQL